MFDIVVRAYPESNPWQNSDNPLMTAPAVVNQLNCEQLAFYNENGYLAVDRVASDHEVAEIRALYDRMFSSRTGRNAGDHFDLAGADEDGKEPLLAQILQPSKYFPELKQTALYRNVGTLIRDLLGTEAELTGDHAINKPPRHGAETPWHQDEAYWDPDKDHCSISVWIPLQPATIRNGCMHFIPCSHRLGVLEHRPIGNDPRVHGLEVVPGIFDFSGAMACELPAGARHLPWWPDVALHTGQLYRRLSSRTYRHRRSASSQAVYAKALSLAGTPEYGSSEKSNHGILNEREETALVSVRKFPIRVRTLSEPDESVCLNGGAYRRACASGADKQDGDPGINQGGVDFRFPF